MAWKSGFDNGSLQVQGDAQKHEEFEVSVCKMALSHRRPVGTDRHECSSVPTGRSSSQASFLDGLFFRREQRNVWKLLSFFLTRCRVSGPICPHVAEERGVGVRRGWRHQPPLHRASEPGRILFTRHRWKKPDRERFLQETHESVLKIEGNVSRLRARSAHFMVLAHPW